MNSFVVEPPKIIVETLTINNYTYALGNLIPHTSVVYGIECFHDTTLVKSIQGILEEEQYKEWTTDDWLGRFIKSKVEELPDVEVRVEPNVEELKSSTSLDDQIPNENAQQSETGVQIIPLLEEAIHLLTTEQSQESQTLWPA